MTIGSSPVVPSPLAAWPPDLPAQAKSAGTGRSRCLQILYLEDSATDQLLVTEALSDAGLDYRLTCVDIREEFLNALCGSGWDIILCDYTIPGYDGMSALREALERRPDVPFIFVSGTIGEERAIESIKAGATDYVLKHHLDRLGMAVRRALELADVRRAGAAAEQRLKTSEERARLLFEHAPDAFYLNDLQGRFIDGNRAAEELVGYRREELIGKSFLELDLIEAADLPRAAASLVRGAEGQPTGPEEYRLRRKDGTRVTIEVRTYPVQFQGKTLVLGIARDITERKLAEADLRQSEEQLRAVWEHSIDGMRLTDHRGRTIAVNEAFCRLVRLPRERLVGNLFTVIYAEDREDGRLDEYCDCFEHGNLISRRIARVRLWNQEEIDLDIAATFVQLGERKFVLTIFRDISERQQAERVAAAFSNLGQRLSAAKTAREAAVIIVDVADQLLGWDCCICDLYSPERDEVTHVLSIDLQDGRRVEFLPKELTHGPSAFARRTLVSGGQLILREAQGPLNAEAIPFGNLTRPSASILYVPIRNGIAVTGLLSIQSYTPGAYDAQSLRTLQALADHCGGALHRIAAQQDLEATRNRLDHLLAESPAVIYSLKLQGELFVPDSYSHYLTQLLGFTPEEARDPGWWPRQVHPADRGSQQAWLSDLLRQKRLTREYRIRHKNGEYRWVHDEQRLVCDSLGEPIEVVGSCVDITERKALEESQHRLATAIEQAAECIIITGVDGMIQYVNPAFEQVTGYSRTEALGHTPRLLKSGRHGPGFYAEMWQTLSAGRSWHGRFINKRKDGNLTEVDATITPIRDGAGSITNYVAVQHDVTRQVQLENQLRQSQKMEAVGQLAGGVAHDFNNLLLVMAGNAELLQMEGVARTDGSRECLQQIIAAAERAANLTRQLLAFSRKQVMQARPVILNDVVANLAKMLKRIIGEHIDLKCHYSIGLPSVHADIGMIEQALVNLVVNARDAMPNGGELHISTECVRLSELDPSTNPEARAGMFVCLTVRDNGTGISPEHLPHLFEPFFTTKQAGKGTGLGLATVYGIIKQHRGWINVTSQLGAGATLKIFLPAVVAPVSPAATPTTQPTIRGGSETILLVEDDLSVRLVTRRVLETAGYKIYEASRAKEALELWAEHSGEIALLLTDIVMPDGVNGRELAERLHGENPEVKIILMSGYSPETAGKDTHLLSKTEALFLQKPCAAVTLLETVRKCLDQRVPEPAPA